MKRLLVYFLILGFSLSNSYVIEILKSPFIIMHFLDHQKTNPFIHFSDFLSMHYLGKDLNDHDTDKDMKLPFKKITRTHYQMLFQNTEKQYSILNLLPVIDAYHCYDEEHLRAATISTLYRPPQFA